MSKPAFKPLTVSVTPDLYDTLKYAAYYSEYSVSAVVNLALDEFMRCKSPNAIKKHLDQAGAMKRRIA